MIERIFGVDGEMSGTELSKGHKLIQIGVAVDTDVNGVILPEPDIFSSYIGWDEDELEWDENSAKVHKIPKEVILNSPKAEIVDELLTEWLQRKGANKDSRRNQIMCGFNVGAFDGPFIKETLPSSVEFFSRRYADLNPLAFILSSGRIDSNGGLISSSTWKKRFKKTGLGYAKKINYDLPEHDAGTDALQALGAWRYIETELKNTEDNSQKWKKLERERRKSRESNNA